MDGSPPHVSMSTSTSAPSSMGVLHCTLFLFDDKLMIVKRPHVSASGRELTGLDQLDKAAKTGGLPLGVKKNGMSFKGVLDITEVVATDVGASGAFDYAGEDCWPVEHNCRRFPSFSRGPTPRSDRKVVWTAFPCPVHRPSAVICWF